MDVPTPQTARVHRLAHLCAAQDAMQPLTRRVAHTMVGCKSNPPLSGAETGHQLARLFRHDESHDWTPVTSAVAAALRVRCAPPR